MGFVTSSRHQGDLAVVHPVTAALSAFFSPASRRPAYTENAMIMSMRNTRHEAIIAQVLIIALPSCSRGVAVWEAEKIAMTVSHYTKREAVIASGAAAWATRLASDATFSVDDLATRPDMKAANATITIKRAIKINIRQEVFSLGGTST